MKIWASCENCVFFRKSGKHQSCQKFALFYLPTQFVFETDNKCCSAYNSKTSDINKPKNKPNFELMNDGVLYFYHSKSPEKLIEDIDL